MQFYVINRKIVFNFCLFLSHIFFLYNNLHNFPLFMNKKHLIIESEKRYAEVKHWND